MSDKELQKLMNQTHDLAFRHKHSLRKLENEYEKRFGNKPSDIDDDFFIDTFSYAQGDPITLEQMTSNANLIKSKA